MLPVVKVVVRRHIPLSVELRWMNLKLEMNLVYKTPFYNKPAAHQALTQFNRFGKDNIKIVGYR